MIEALATATETPRLRLNSKKSRGTNRARTYGLGNRTVRTKSLELQIAVEQQKIAIRNKYGEKLVGLLHETGSTEIVILCHGFRCVKEFNIMTNVAVALEKEGISVFRFDFAGNGHNLRNLTKEEDPVPTSASTPLPSMHPFLSDVRCDCHFSIARRFGFHDNCRDFLSSTAVRDGFSPSLRTKSSLLEIESSVAAAKSESEGTFEFVTYAREADDLHAIIQHFKGTGRVITAILGHSKGGDVVLLYASKYQDIPTVVNVSGLYDLKRGLEDRLGEDFLQRIKKDGFIDAHGLYELGIPRHKGAGDSLRGPRSAYLHPVTPVPALVQADPRELRELGTAVLTVHGSDDEVIPVEDAYEFDKIIPNHKLHIIEGADHGYTSHQPQLVSLVVPFIKDGLKHLQK
ncbi:hypothetical protein LguiB_018584 [Lonicera macranthoides]